MTRIKRAPKKPPEANPRAVELIKDLTALPEEDLTAALEAVNFEGWQWPRSDLVFWIPVLNRLDQVLENVVKSYDLRGTWSRKEKDADGKEIKEDPAVEARRLGVQMNPFTPRTKRTVLAILGFEKLLLENCTNRKMFSSYDRANDLLLTNDPDVLLATLRLCIRPAQQWSTQHVEIPSGFGISHARLLDLAQSWSLASDPSALPVSFLDVLLADTASKAGGQEVTFQFYRKADSAPAKSADAPAVVDKGKRREEPDGPQASSSAPQSSAPASTPLPKGRSKDKDKTPAQTPGPAHPPGTSTAIEGLTTVRVSPRQLISTDRAQDILADLVEEHAIPAEHRLRLFQRVRLAMAMRDPRAKSQMAVVRLLALALYMHTTDESTATSKIFIFEPNLVAQLAELVHPDKGVTREVQAAAFYALEAAGRYRGRISEVTSAVGVSVSHGVLMQVVRKLARDLVQPETGLSLEYIDSVFCFLSCLQQSAYAGALLVGAGIVPVLVDLCKTAHVDHIAVVTRAVTSLDGLMFGFQTAFPLFTQAEGMKVFVGRIKEQVDLAVSTHSGTGSSPMKPSELLTGLLSHPAAGLLKALLRAIQRLLSSAGTMDSVRNLTETPLPTAIKLVMQHKAIFGYQIYSLAINQMSTIIHSEPTSLAILQEAELPEAFYDAIEAGIEPAFDVIAAIPAALGALCLNETGLTQLNKRGAIEALFAIFASDKHAKVLRERDCASVLGGSLDELIRHQPTLKPTILEHSVALVKRLAEVGKDWQPPEDKRSFYWLKPDRADAEVEMKDDASPAASKDNGKASEPATEIGPAPEKEKAHADNAPLLMLDVTCRFLEAMLQNVATCQDFFHEGTSTLLDILHLPFIPYDFGVPPTVDAFSSLMRVLSEAMPQDTLVAVMAQLKKSMARSEAFWKPMVKSSDEGHFLKMVQLSSDGVESAQAQFRALVAAAALVSMLGDICIAGGYAHTRTTISVLSTLNGAEETKVVTGLGHLQASMLFQSVALKAGVPAAWQEQPAATDAVAAAAEAKETPALADGVSTALAASTSSPRLAAAPFAKRKLSDGEISNAKTLRQLSSLLTSALQPFFAGVIKLLSSRRGHDQGVRKQSHLVANTLAGALLAPLVWLDSGDISLDYACATVAIGTVATFLTEERSSKKTVNTLLLVPFDKAGGVDALLSLFDRYLDQADASVTPTTLPATVVVQVMGGLKVSLDLFHTLATAAALLESPQTALLVGSKDESFDAPNVIVSLRARILPRIARMWEADWLRTSPPNVVRSVVRIILEVIKGEGEASGDVSIRSTGSSQAGVGIPALPFPGARPPTVPNEVYVANLMDMGFPRSVCETALARTQNNINLATEFLLAQPNLIQRARDEEANQAARQANPEPPAAEPVPSTEASSSAAPPAQDTAMADSAPESSTAVSANAEASSSKSNVRAELDAARAKVKETLIEKGVALSEPYEDLVFELKMAFKIFEQKATPSSPFSSFDLLSRQCRQLSAESVTDGSRVGLARRFRILALLANDDALESRLREHAESLLRLCMDCLERSGAGSGALELPEWLAPALLLVEATMTINNSPAPSTILEPDEDSPPTQLVRAPRLADRQDLLFSVCQTLVAQPGDRGRMLAGMRVLLLLTDDHAYAERFLQSGMVTTVLRGFASQTETRGALPLAIMFLRHIIESRPVRLAVMVRSLESALAAPRARVMDVASLARSLSPLAWRDPETVMEALVKTCKLVDPDPATGQYHISPQRDADDSTPSAPLKIPTGDAQMDQDDVAAVGGRPSVPSYIEEVVHLLLGELLRSGREILQAPAVDGDAKSPPPSSASARPTDTDVAPTGQPASTPAGKGVESESFIASFSHLCFVMSWLSELLASYPECKTSFISFREAGSTSSKGRHPITSFLLNDLIPIGPLMQRNSAESQKRGAIASWAVMVLIALCHDPTSGKTPPESVTQARDLVVGALCQSLKANLHDGEESADVRYGRLYSLGDLAYRLLTYSAFGGQKTAAVSNEPQMQIAKVMLERNLASLLSGALAEVDLNFPSVQRLLDCILRPLEHLTKAVTKLSRTAAAPDAVGIDIRSVRSYSSSPDEDMDEREEEEAPDLYRSSALGLYHGELEPGHRDADQMSSDDDDDMDEDEEDEMELEDGAMLNDSDLSDVSDDEGTGDVTMDPMGDDMSVDDDDDEEDEDEDSDGSQVVDDDDDDDDDEDPTEGGSESDVDQTDGDIHMSVPLYRSGSLHSPRDSIRSRMGSLIEGDEDGELGNWGEAGPADALSHDAAQIVALAGGAQDGDLQEVLSAGDGDEIVVDRADDGRDLVEEDEEDEDEEADEGEADAEPLQGGGEWSWNGVLPFDPAGGAGGAEQATSRTLLRDLDIVMGRRTTPHAAHAGDIGTHPLLAEEPASQTSNDAGIRSQRRAGTTQLNEWVSSIEGIIGGGITEMVEQLLSHPNIGDGPIHLQLGSGPNGPSLGGIVVDPRRGIIMPVGPNGSPPRPTGQQSAAPPTRLDRHLADRVGGHTLMPLPSPARWAEEARLFHANLTAPERLSRLTTQIVNYLLPAARATAKAQKEQNAEREAARKAEEEKQAAEEKDKDAQPPSNEDDEDAASSHGSEDIEMLDRNDEDEEGVPDAPSVADTSAAVTDAAQAMEGVTVQDDNGDAPPPAGDVAEVMNLARQLAASVGDAAPVQPTERPASQAEPEPAPPAADSSSAEEAPPQASGSEPRQRVTITIRGSEVDITDTGIDPEFLEALPDDMREEVLNQHFRENRSAREEPALPVPSTINAEFLEALPPEIRSEVIRAEAADQERRRRTEERTRQRAEGGAAAVPPAGPADIDPATFLATLAPGLREEVLMEQDDGFLSTLPAQMLAEASSWRDQTRRRADQRAGMQIAGVHTHIGTGPKKAGPKTDALQVLDRAGIAALVRLLFFPQPLRRHSLQKVLVNLCENSRSRIELVGTLLNLLQDGVRNTSSIDKLFANVSAKAQRVGPSASQAPNATPQRPRRDADGVANAPTFPGESVPNLIGLRCLESLSLLVQSNDRIPIYFLTEQEVREPLHREALSLKKSAKKAAKNRATAYPILTLLNLLDEPTFARQPNLIESIVSLLALVCRPLASLPKQAEGEAAKTMTSQASATGASAPEAATDSQGVIASAPAATEPKKEGTLEKAPTIPAAELRMIVNPLDAGECSSKTFGHTLTTIQYLSMMPEARQIISSELATRAQALGTRLLPSLEELLGALRSATAAADVKSTTLAQFSSASAPQAKLLRLLKTIEFLEAQAEKDRKPAVEASPETPVVAMSMSFSSATSGAPLFSPGTGEWPGSRDQFRPLWQGLSDCLVAIADKDELAPVATILLPLMESFLVVCKNAGVSTSVAVPRGSASPLSEAVDPRIGPTAFFLSFTERHRKVLNLMVRNNPGLMSGSFSILVHNPKVLEFDNKRNYFQQQLRKAANREAYGTIQLNVRRPHVFEDSFHSLARRTGDELKHGKLSVRFYDEEGVDAGGLTREWLSILVKQMLDPNYALFLGSAADSKTYQPNRASAVNPDHLVFFTFCGRVIGKALYDGRTVDAYFTIAFYKHLLGVPVGLSDLESVDPDHHRSLKWMLENDIDGVLDLTFSVEADDFGKTRVVDLKPDGSNIAVTNDNKAEYVQLLVQHRLTESIKDQIEAFRKGFDDVVPQKLVSIFSAPELQLLLNGLPDINVEDWRANTELHQLQQSDAVVSWFWRAVRSFDQEERAKLLQFSTGSSRLPVEGFQGLQGAQGATKFSLVNAHTKNVLPSAHTCFNQIDLPSYDSYEDLRRMVLIAINEGSEGFGFA